MKYIFCIILIVSQIKCLSQTITGRIIDEFNKPLFGAYIRIINSTIHTQSNADGIFNFDLQKIIGFPITLELLMLEVL